MLVLSACEYGPWSGQLVCHIVSLASGGVTRGGSGSPVVWTTASRVPDTERGRERARKM